MDFVVPFSMELISVEIELSDLLVGDLDACGVGAGIQFGMDLQSGRGAGGSNQAHNDLKTDQWLSTPVLSNARKETVFDLVPFAGARRKMADGDAQCGFIGELLQFQFPQPHTGATASAAVSGNRQAGGLRVCLLPH